METLALHIDDLVRWNLNSLLQDLHDSDLIHRSWIRELLEEGAGGLAPTGQPRIPLTDGILDVPDPHRWSRASLAKALNWTAGGIRAVLAKPSMTSTRRRSGGTKKLGVGEAMVLALELGVTPARLLQPMIEHLERDLMLEIKDFGANARLIPAREWYAWVNGLAPVSEAGWHLAAIDSYGRTGADLDVSRDTWLDDAKRRVGALAPTSDTWVKLAEVPGSGLKDPSPLEAAIGSSVATAALGAVAAKQRRFEVEALLLHHVRQGVELMTLRSSAGHVESLAWIARRLITDLASISKAQ